MSKRFIVEGTWSGYRASQSKPCHRRVVSKKEAERLGQITTVQFHDGTTMNISVRPAALREKVKEIDGYSHLLRSFLAAGMTGFVRVRDLPGGGA